MLSSSSTAPASNNSSSSQLSTRDGQKSAKRSLNAVFKNSPDALKPLAEIILKLEGSIWLHRHMNCYTRKNLNRHEIIYQLCSVQHLDSLLSSDQLRSIADTMRVVQTRAEANSQHVTNGTALESMEDLVVTLCAVFNPRSELFEMFVQQFVPDIQDLDLASIILNNAQRSLPAPPVATSQSADSDSAGDDDDSSIAVEEDDDVILVPQWSAAVIARHVYSLRAVTSTLSQSTYIRKFQELQAEAKKENQLQAYQAAAHMWMDCSINPGSYHPAELNEYQQMWKRCDDLLAGACRGKYLACRNLFPLMEFCLMANAQDAHADADADADADDTAQATQSVSNDDPDVVVLSGRPSTSTNSRRAHSKRNVATEAPVAAHSLDPSKLLRYIESKKEEVKQLEVQAARQDDLVNDFEKQIGRLDQELASNEIARDAEKSRHERAMEDIVSKRGDLLLDQSRFTSAITSARTDKQKLMDERVALLAEIHKRMQAYNTLAEICALDNAIDSNSSSSSGSNTAMSRSSSKKRPVVEDPLNKQFESWIGQNPLHSGDATASFTIESFTTDSNAAASTAVSKAHPSLLEYAWYITVEKTQQSTASSALWTLIEPYYAQFILEWTYQNSVQGKQSNISVTIYRHSPQFQYLIPCQYNMGAMTQTNLLNAHEFRIKRERITKPVQTRIYHNMKFPVHWIRYPSMHPPAPTSEWVNSTMLIPMDKSSARYQFLEKSIMDSSQGLNIQVEALFQLQNVTQLSAYNARKAAMRLEMAEDLEYIQQKKFKSLMFTPPPVKRTKRSPGSAAASSSSSSSSSNTGVHSSEEWVAKMINEDVEVCNVYHGTKPELVQSIIDRGLCIDRAANANANQVNQFGAGIYVGTTSYISLNRVNNYAPPSGVTTGTVTNTRQCLFIADCLTGWSMQGTRADLRASPLLRPGYPGCNYHSTWGHDRTYLNLWANDQVLLHTFAVIKCT